jgi:hypothetical protein
MRFQTLGIGVLDLERGINFGVKKTNGLFNLTVDETNSLLKIRPATDDTGALNIGDGTYDMDVKIFLGTTAKYALFDVGNSAVSLIGGVTLTIGADTAGADFKVFGATTGCSVLWDASEDQLVITGPADVPALKIAGAGSKSAEAYAAYGSAWADGGTPAFVADQAYAKINLGGTVYRLPLFADS